MSSQTETLMKFDGFRGWKWEDEFQQALSAYKPHADHEAVTSMRFYIVADFVDFVREVVSEEFDLGLQVDVTEINGEGVAGRVDLPNRKRVLDGIERRIAAWGSVPKLCKTGPILDRLLACTEFVRAPDRLRFGEFKRECLVRYRNDGSVARAVEFANPDGSHDHPFKVG